MDDEKRNLRIHSHCGMDRGIADRQRLWSLKREVLKNGKRHWKKERDVGGRTEVGRRREVLEDEERC